MTASVTGCSTCRRVLTSMNEKRCALGLVEELDRAGVAVAGEQREPAARPRDLALLLGRSAPGWRTPRRPSGGGAGRCSRARRAPTRRPGRRRSAAPRRGARRRPRCSISTRAVAERLLGLGAGALERVLELVGAVDAAHPAAAAAGRGLDHQREADRVGVALGVLDGLDRPPLHGATGTPACSASRLASILSPSARMTSASGPTNTIPRRSHSSANSGCSATKPQPTQAASARVSVSARSSSS